MRCPKCGTEMNRHAEKPLKGSLPAELSPLDENKREVIAEIHYCPGCGKVEATVEKNSGPCYSNPKF